MEGRSFANAKEAITGGAVVIEAATLASLALRAATPAAIHVAFVGVPLTVETVCDAAAVKSADESRRAVIEAAVDAITLTVRVRSVRQPIAVVVQTVVAH